MTIDSQGFQEYEGTFPYTEEELGAAGGSSSTPIVEYDVTSDSEEEGASVGDEITERVAEEQTVGVQPEGGLGVQVQATRALLRRFEREIESIAGVNEVVVREVGQGQEEVSTREDLGATAGGYSPISPASPPERHTE